MSCRRSLWNNLGLLAMGVRGIGVCRPKREIRRGMGIGFRVSKRLLADQLGRE